MVPSGEDPLHFHDDLDPSLGSMVEVKDAAGTAGLGLGLITALFPDTYAIRFNSFAGTQDTKVPRSAGWHLFEIIVTPQGSYGKVDNQLFGEVNPALVSAAAVSFVATWGLTGTSIYDDLTLWAADRRPYRQQVCSILEAFYRTYGATDFSGLYPTLGTAMHSNDLRTLFDTAAVFALYGRLSGDGAALARGRALYLDGLSHGRWAQIDDWARGVAMDTVARATQILWPDLDAAARASATQLLADQARRYLDRLPESGYLGDTKAEENAWHAMFLAGVTTFFPALPDAAALEAKARCFAYHSITRSTDPAYCGVKTQTVADTFELENHGQTSPIYATATIHILGKGGLSYARAGQPVPVEFQHNVAGLAQRLLTHIDPQTYHFIGAPSDWSGATNSFYYGALALGYAQTLGLLPTLSLQDLLEKRSLFYRGMASEWVPLPPASISAFTQGDPTSTSYRWFLDTNTAGNVFAMLLHLL